MPIPFWVGHYIGLSFKEHGRNRLGVDCWGLVRLIYAERFSVALPSYVYAYPNTTSPEILGELVGKESQKWKVVALGEERLGDVIVLRIHGHPMHVGIVIGDQQMLHIQTGINASIENYQNMRWKNRIVGFYRHKEVGNVTI